MPSPLKVLVVDDVPANRLLVRKILERNNFEVVEAGNGSEALERIETSKCDIVLLDIMMPEMDGVTACAKLREKYSLTELPIIMVTSRTEDDDLVESLSAGANDYITKPINATILLARLNAQARVLRASRLLLRTQQQMAARQRMETVGLFAAAVAHNFNNILGTIMGSAELLKDSLGAENRAMHGPLELIVASSKRAADLTYSLLTFAGTESATYCPNPAEIVRTSIPLAEAISGPRISYTVRAEDEVPAVAISTADLSAVLLQLLKNSVEAIDNEGHISVSLTTHNDGPSGEDVAVFTVKDSGRGVPPDKIGRVFEPFFSTKGGGDDERMMMALDGSGLGLSVVYNLVRQSGGTIDIVSPDGEGTTVWFAIPLYRAA